MKINFERIIETIKDVSYDQFVQDLDVQDITMFNLIQISENVNIYQIHIRIIAKIFLGQIYMDLEIE